MIGHFFAHASLVLPGFVLFIAMVLAREVGAYASKVPARRPGARADTDGVVGGIGFMYRFGDAVRRWRAEPTRRVGMYAGSYHCNALHAPWWREQAKSGGQILEQAIRQKVFVVRSFGTFSGVDQRSVGLIWGLMVKRRVCGVASADARW